jgi:DHA2 family multidrug resistance protein
LMRPRGIGTMASMIIVGRLVSRVDPRFLVSLGLILTAASLYFMTGFSPQMGSGPVIWTGVLQRMGLGLVFVPLSTIAFSTIDPIYRADATSLFSLVRNIGSSIGISIVTVMLTRNLQINHAERLARISPFNPNITDLLTSISPTSLQIFDGFVRQQALMIRYLDDFKLMMIITLCARP